MGSRRHMVVVFSVLLFNFTDKGRSRTHGKPQAYGRRNIVWVSAVKNHECIAFGLKKRNHPLLP